MDKKIPYRLASTLKFRQLIVKDKCWVADSFHRVTLTGSDLADFTSHSFDDHIKVFFPDASGKVIVPEITDGGIVWPDGYRPVARDYTPLAFDNRALTLTIDFYQHANGVASDWAEAARPGDSLLIGGPRSSLVIPSDYRWQLYICDESGLPALRRRLMSTPAVAQRYCLICSDNPPQPDYFNDIPQAKVEWLSREALTSRVDSLEIPEDDYFIWLTGEGHEVKQLSDRLLTVHQVEPERLRAIAYWHRKTKR